MDGEGSSWFGNWASFQLGQMFAEHRRSSVETAAVLLGHRRQAVDVNALLAQNQALAAENQKLRQDLADYKYNYDRLNAWADDASRRLKAYKSQERRL